ncbi:MAG: hypothetical protein PF588_09360 [Candidatus Kapabacteria bacterium]|jgi:hypothetical protein|nr:hypothetical protein [Candidatus Kapabacteria bacterium]
MKKLTILIIGIVGISFWSCQTDTTSTNPDLFPGGEVVYFSDCKDGETNEIAKEIDNSHAAIQYHSIAEEHKLEIRHINAGFNCCPDEITADISIEDGVISISEKEAVAGCKCNCLYDIDIDVTDIEKGKYTVKVIEPYLNDVDLEFNFEIDLNENPDGEFVLERSSYPWAVK